MYVSLSEIQIKEEEEAMNRPFTKVTCFTSFVKWINDLSLLVIKSIHVQRPLFRWYAFVHLATTVHVFPRLAPVACFPALCAGYMPVFPRFLLSRRNIYLNMSLVAWYWERPGTEFVFILTAEWLVWLKTSLNQVSILDLILDYLRWCWWKVKFLCVFSYLTDEFLYLSREKSTSHRTGWNSYTKLCFQTCHSMW